jgi:hypothetical protein
VQVQPVQVQVQVEVGLMVAPFGVLVAVGTMAVGTMARCVVRFAPC